jgi:ATP-dependent Clp protease ATP-binding subunit ClpC
MFERYTEPARRTIFVARQEASQSDFPYITVEHLLLALLRSDAKLFEILLPESKNGKGLEKELRIELEKAVPPRISTSNDLPLENRSKRALAYAAEEAERLSDRHIGTEHLLLGLLREPSLAAETLRTNGIDLRGARQRLGVGKRLREPPPPPDIAEMT